MIASINPPKLSPRQALICAALAGGAGNPPSSWHCPVSRDTILAWANSYLPSGDATQLDAAFELLVRDKLFKRVCYPIFAKPQYYCAYWSDFIDELPANIDEYVAPQEPGTVSDHSSLKNLWDYLFEKFSEESGVAWMYWGLCAGQGSEGPSDAPWGPCLGPSCCCFEAGELSCNHEIEFVEQHHEDLPDMSFLDYLNRAEWADRQDQQQAICEQLVEQLGFTHEA